MYIQVGIGTDGFARGEVESILSNINDWIMCFNENLSLPFYNKKHIPKLPATPCRTEYIPSVCVAFQCSKFFASSLGITFTKERANKIIKKRPRQIVYGQDCEESAKIFIADVFVQSFCLDVLTHGAINHKMYVLLKTVNRVFT